MTFNEAYERYLLELESNGITDKISSTKGRFAVNYNKFLNRLVEYFIERKIDDDNRYIQILKEIDVPISRSSKTKNSDIFKFPKNYFDFIDLTAYGSSEKCKNQIFNVREIKAENLNSYRTDEFTKPSFKFRESYYIINKDGITLDKDQDFEFNKILLSYYRKPQEIQLIDKDNPESDFITAEIEFDEKFTNRVITLAASGHSLNTDDPKFQALMQQAISKI